MTFKRKYIDLSRELADKLAIVCATLRMPQRVFIENAVANAIAEHEKQSQKPQKGKRK